jgi:8-oxo-dGTP pyrophosphatase MutT (NUDIX family)
VSGRGAVAGQCAQVNPEPALPRITDPRAVPVIGTDAHLAPVPLANLRAASLRERIASLADHGFEPEFPGDGGRFFPDRTPTAASVLVPLVQREGELYLLLTERTSHLRDHAGQISFPGGRAEVDDADVVATALRETEEEVGLHRRHVEVIGTLPTYTTVTQYVVTPVVALVAPPFELSLDSFEVATAFEVPLAFLMNPAHHCRHAIELAGTRRHFLSMPWQDAVLGREFFIWGATAAMIRNLYRALALPPAPR